jgi:hypothetical protein
MCDLDGSNLKRGEIALLISAVSFVATAAGFDVSLQSQGIHKQLDIKTLQAVDN